MAARFHEEIVKRQGPDGPAGGPDGHHHGGNGGVATAIPIIYLTKSKDFSGPVMGYTTIGVPAGPEPTPSAQEPTAAPSSEPVVTSAASEPEPTHESSSTPLLNSFTSSADSTFQTSAAATDSFAAATDSAISSPSPTSSSSSSGGLSSGAQAGIAIAVIALVGLVAGIAFFAWRRKKQSSEVDEKQRAENEKNPFGDSAAAPPPSAAAPPMMANIPPPPHLAASHNSAVPSERFFDGPAMSGAMAGGAGAAAGFGAAAAMRSNQSVNQSINQPLEKPVNPFAENNASQASLHSIPIGAEAEMAPPIASDSELALGATVAGAAIAQRPAASPNMEQGPPRPLPPFAAGAVPGSPAVSTFSVDSSASGPAGGRPNGPPVHRVQLDFKGSMHDEMDVRIGDIVAIVHEYDDGWVLARKLDKSKQGVCPRSCLSNRPLQPRRGPAPPGARGPPPPRTASPAPSNGPGPMMGRASPAPSHRGPPGGPGPMRTASPAPSVGPMPPRGRASPAPGSRAQSPALNPNLANWPAKPINASTITPNMNQWPMKPTNAPSAQNNMVKRSMSPGPYGGGPPVQGSRPSGATKRRSNSMGNVPQPRPVVPGFPGADRMTTMSDRSADDSMNLPIQSPGSPVARKPVPGMAS